MTEDQLTKAVERLDKRLDWIEENLVREVGLKYVAMGRGEARPDEGSVPADVLELLTNGNKMEAIQRYREHTGVDFTHAREALKDL